ncbi:MAG: Flp pilus assembly protein CpaB, partial [Clostridia bacterium]|nr:Flp pilus assembly protein CpaB [Clostridia bacterium]
MKNRTIIGIICIVLALVVTFAVAPLVNKLAESKVDIVRMKSDVVQGHQISDNDVEVVKVGGYNLPADVIVRKEYVVGKFAATDLKAGDYLLPSKLSTTSDKANDVFRTLNGDKQAISITIRTFAGGLSGKLENGDIVQLVVYENDTSKAIMPGALTYVKVITTTTAEGADKDELTVNEDGTYELPSTVTLLVNREQAKLLVEYENSGRIHADLVFRGDDAIAQK